MEAKTFLCMMLNFFSFKLPDGFEMVTSCKDGGAAPSPEDLRLYISARPGGPLARAWAGLMKGEMPTAAPAAAPTATAAAGAAPAVPAAKHDTPLLVLFGSNGGTCEDFANQVAAAARYAPSHEQRFSWPVHPSLFGYHTARGRVVPEPPFSLSPNLLAQRAGLQANRA